jgi:hypothetical protein
VRGGARPARVLEERLRLGAGFGAEERGHVLEICPTLSRHLAHWSPEQVDLEISVKNRGGRELKVPPQAWLPRWPSLVATSTDRELDHALIEVYNDMIRQIEDGRTKRELGKPRASRWGPFDSGANGFGSQCQQISGHTGSQESSSWQRARYQAPPSTPRRRLGCAPRRKAGGSALSLTAIHKLLRCPGPGMLAG